MDLRSARRFQWTVRAMVIVPVVAGFAYLLSKSGGLEGLITVSGPQLGSTESFWEPRLLWTIGATLSPVLPIGLALAVILSTDVSHWFFLKHLDLTRQNRTMVLSFYLCPALAWIWLPVLACGAVLILDNPDWVDWSDTIAIVARSFAILAVLSTLVLLPPVLSSSRAVCAATHCGAFSWLIICVGLFGQAVASCLIGFGLFPMVAGLFRLMITSLLR